MHGILQIARTLGGDNLEVCYRCGKEGGFFQCARVTREGEEANIVIVGSSFLVYMPGIGWFISSINVIEEPAPFEVERISGLQIRVK